MTMADLNVVFMPSDYGPNICGALRKFRNEDLPKISSLGGAELDLPLADGQGFRNTIVLFIIQNIVYLHCTFNSHANHVSRVRGNTTRIMGCECELTPIGFRRYLQKIA